MTDAQRLRLLFIVTGSGLACLFGIVWSSVDRFDVSSRGSELTRSRRWALSSALPVFIVTIGWIVAMTTFSGLSAFVLRRSTLLGVVGFMVLVHGASAVIVTELVRTMVARTARWSDRRHFAAVGMLWMLFCDGRLAAVASMAEARRALTLGGSRGPVRC
jgi:hypothetical protein